LDDSESGTGTSYGGGGGVRHCYLYGSSAGTGGIDLREVTFSRIEDNSIQGFSNGYGVQGENVNSISRWTENNLLASNHLLGNKVAIQLADNCTGHSKCSSFAYWTVTDTELSIPASGTGLALLNDSLIGGGFWDLKLFLGQGATGIHLSGTSQISLLKRFAITGEIASPSVTHAYGIVTDTGTTLQSHVIETWNDNISIITDSLGGNTIPYATDYNPNYASLFYDVNGVGIGSTASSYYSRFDVHNITNYRTYTFPDATGFLPVFGSNNTTSQWLGFAGSPTVPSAGGVYLGTIGGGGQAFFWNNGAGTNLKGFDFYNDASGVLHGRLVDDNFTGTNDWIQVTRSGYSTAPVSFPESINANGYAVAGKTVLPSTITGYSSDGGSEAGPTSAIASGRPADGCAQWVSGLLRSTSAACGSANGSFDGGVLIGNAGATGKAACIKSDKTIGYCSTAIGPDGSCTCN
jgi:hypothetical protein